MEREEGNNLTPDTPPALTNRRVFPTPFRGFKIRECLFAVVGVFGLVDGFQRRRYGFPILIGDEVETVAQQMDDADCPCDLRGR
jgi:hypothetical protein